MCKNTIEEQILALAQTKLALDQSLSDDSPANSDDLEKKGEELVAKMLLGKPAESEATTPAVGTPAPA